MCHIYPRDYTEGMPKISFTPEDIAWAVNCALELGVDVIKVPYCDDIKAISPIIGQTSLLIVAAGGPKQENIRSALDLITDVIESSAIGATIGHNVWGSNKITEVIKTFKAVILDGEAVSKVISRVGLFE
jgi:DhnA family fructose-bisphosphate aldolase class Ia